MEKDYLILKRASASRPSGEWQHDDFDVLANGAVVGRIFKVNARRVDVDLHLPAPRRSHAHPRHPGSAWEEVDGDGLIAGLEHGVRWSSGGGHVWAILGGPATDRADTATATAGTPTDA